MKFLHSSANSPLPPFLEKRRKCFTLLISPLSSYFPEQRNGKRLTGGFHRSMAHFLPPPTSSTTCFPSHSCRLSEKTFFSSFLLLLRSQTTDLFKGSCTSVRPSLHPSVRPSGKRKWQQQQQQQQPQPQQQ